MSSNQCNTCESLSFNFWYLVIVNRGLSACSYTLPIKACSQTCIPWTKLSTSIFCPSGETIQQQECLGGLIFALPSVPNRESIEKLCLPVPVPVERMHFVLICILLLNDNSPQIKKDSSVRSSSCISRMFLFLWHMLLHCRCTTSATTL